MSLLPAALREEVRAAFVRAAAYVRSCQSPSGGFCFYRTADLDEPSLGDTHHAVAALRVIGAEIPREDDVARFVDERPLGGLTYVYFWASTLDLLARTLDASTS